MIDILLNLETGLAKATVSPVIKAGALVPVRITLAVDPGAAPAWELALSAQGSTPATLAYLDTLTAESATVWLGDWDTNDTRLIDFMAGKQTATLDMEVAWTLGGLREVAPNIAVQVQRRIVTGPEP